MPNFTKDQINKIIKDYKNNVPIREIIKDNNLYDNSHLYRVLKRNNVQLRTKKRGGKNEEFKIFKIEDKKYKTGFIARIANAHPDDIDKIYEEYKN